MLFGAGYTDVSPRGQNALLSASVERGTTRRERPRAQSRVSQRLPGQTSELNSGPPKPQSQQQQRRRRRQRQHHRRYEASAIIILDVSHTRPPAIHASADQPGRKTWPASTSLLRLPPPPPRLCRRRARVLTPVSCHRPHPSTPPPRARAPPWPQPRHAPATPATRAATRG